MQDDLTNEIARVLVETQAATVENRALALRPIIARERENAAAAQKERDADGMVMVPIEPTEAMLEAVVPFPEHLFADGKRGADYRKDMEIAVMVDRAAFVSQYRKAIAAIRSAG